MKKYLLFAVIILGAVFFAATEVYAATSFVYIDSAGVASLRGTVETTGTNSIVVRSRGGLWTIQTGVNGNVFVLPARGMSGLSSLGMGDSIGVIGIEAGNQPWTINAAIVRDWSTSNESIQVNTVTTTSGLFLGLVSNIGVDSFALSSPSGGGYSVKITNDTALWNNALRNIAFSTIQPGDSVKVIGALSGNTITAKIVRDTSR